MSVVIDIKSDAEWADVQRFIINRDGCWSSGCRKVKTERTDYGDSACIRISASLRMCYAPRIFYKSDSREFKIISFDTFMKSISEGKYGSSTH